MKKILIALLILALFVTLIACSKTDENGAESSSTPTYSSDDPSSDDGSSDIGSDGGSDSGSDGSSDSSSEEESYAPAPEDIDHIGGFREDFVPNVSPDNVDDSYEWIS